MSDDRRPGGAAGWTPPVVVPETPSEEQQAALPEAIPQQAIRWWGMQYVEDGIDYDLVEGFGLVSAQPVIPFVWEADPLVAKLEQAVEATKNMTPDERAAMWREQKASFVRAEMGFGSDADEAKYAAALASGDPARIAECKAEEADRMAYAEAAMEASGQKPRGGAARADVPSPVTDEMVDAETPHPEIIAAIQAEAFERAAQAVAQFSRLDHIARDMRGEVFPEKSDLQSTLA